MWCYDDVGVLEKKIANIWQKEKSCHAQFIMMSCRVADIEGEVNINTFKLNIIQYNNNGINGLVIEHVDFMKSI